MKTNPNQRSNEPDTLRFHREMYERRMRTITYREGRTERELVDDANDPAFFRRETATPIRPVTKTDRNDHS